MSPLQRLGSSLSNLGTLLQALGREASDAGICDLKFPSASTSAASFGGSRPIDRKRSAMALRGIMSPLRAAVS
jgi:hypothetical protein